MFFLKKKITYDIIHQKSEKGNYKCEKIRKKKRKKTLLLANYWRIKCTILYSLYSI